MNRPMSQSTNREKMSPVRISLPAWYFSHQIDTYNNEMRHPHNGCRRRISVASDGNTAWRFDPEQEHVVVQPVASQIAGVAAGSGDRTSWERMRFVAWEFIQQIDLTRVDVVDATRAEDAARGRRRLVTRPAGDDNKTWREATLVVDSDDQIESMEVCLGTAWQSVTIYVEVVDRGREYDPEYFVYQRYVSEAVPVVPGPSTLEQLRAFGYITTDEATDSPRLREMGYIDR